MTAEIRATESAAYTSTLTIIEGGRTSVLTETLTGQQVNALLASLGKGDTTVQNGDAIATLSQRQNGVVSRLFVRAA
ncbi:hypothetical protein ABZT26_36110 [Streptomyces sp. NPDC005395]|uniref:hypothetical protein n=1 Tax=Streptomyces sp. NPDC005395 TaxID=3157042 RepID=UPI0033B94132